MRQSEPSSSDSAAPVQQKHRDTYERHVALLSASRQCADLPDLDLNRWLRQSQRERASTAVLAADVIPDGPDPEHQALSDLPVREPGGDQRGDLALPPG